MSLVPASRRDFLHRMLVASATLLNLSGCGPAENEPTSAATPHEGDGTRSERPPAQAEAGESLGNWMLSPGDVRIGVEQGGEHFVHDSPGYWSSEDRVLRPR